MPAAAAAPLLPRQCSAASTFSTATVPSTQAKVHPLSLGLVGAPKMPETWAAGQPPPDKLWVGDGRGCPSEAPKVASGLLLPLTAGIATGSSIGSTEGTAAPSEDTVFGANYIFGAETPSTGGGGGCSVKVGAPFDQPRESIRQRVGGWSSPRCRATGPHVRPSPRTPPPPPPTATKQRAEERKSPTRRAEPSSSAWSPARSSGSSTPPPPKGDASRPSPRSSPVGASSPQRPLQTTPRVKRSPVPSPPRSPRSPGMSFGFAEYKDSFGSLKLTPGIASPKSSRRVLGPGNASLPGSLRVGPWAPCKGLPGAAPAAKQPMRQRSHPDPQVDTSVGLRRSPRTLLSRVSEECNGTPKNRRQESLASALCSMEDSVRSLYEHGTGSSPRCGPQASASMPRLASSYSQPDGSAPAGAGATGPSGRKTNGPLARHMSRGMSARAPASGEGVCLASLGHSPSLAISEDPAANDQADSTLAPARGLPGRMYSIESSCSSLGSRTTGLDSLAGSCTLRRSAPPSGAPSRWVSAVLVDEQVDEQEVLSKLLDEQLLVRRGSGAGTVEAGGQDASLGSIESGSSVSKQM